MRLELDTNNLNQKDLDMLAVLANVKPQVEQVEVEPVSPESDTTLVNAEELVKAQAELDKIMAENERLKSDLDTCSKAKDKELKKVKKELKDAKAEIITLTDENAKLKEVAFAPEREAEPTAEQATETVEEPETVEEKVEETPKEETVASTDVTSEPVADEPVITMETNGDFAREFNGYLQAKGLSFNDMKVLTPELVGQIMGEMKGTNPQSVVYAKFDTLKK